MVFCRATTLVARGRDGQRNVTNSFTFASIEAQAASVAALHLIHSARLLTTEALRFNPFPLRDFPYLTTFAGAEKVTLRLLWSEKGSFCSSVLRSNIGELSSYARLRG